MAIFTASTFSIVFVIWIAKIADYESNMSPCTKSIASWLARIPCCGKNLKSCCRCKRSVSISAAKGEELRENGRFSRNNSRVDSDPSPDNDAGEICGGDVITWQDFASSLDQILFVFFFIFIAVSSLVLFIFWGLEYERNNWEKVSNNSAYFYMIEYKLLELTYRAYHKPVLRYYLYLVLIFCSRFVIFMTIKIRREIHIRGQIYHYISNKFTEYICLIVYFIILICL